MATASKGDVTTLTLSVDEAETLCVVLRKIGGSPSNTRRGYTEAIYIALYQAGFNLSYNSMDGYEMLGAMTFDRQRPPAKE